MMNKKLLYPLLALAAAAGIAFLLLSNKPQPPAEQRDSLPVTVRVTEVTPVTERLSVSSQGTVQPRTISELIPEVSGRVTWISPALAPGGAFSAGDILLRIDDADYASALARAEAAHDRAAVEQEYAEDELRRLEQLFARKLASQSQLDAARRASRVADANLLDSSAALQQARRDLARTEVTAPFDGLVRSEHVDVGQFVSRGNSIAIIFASDYAEIRLPIAANQIGFLDLPISIRGQIPEALRPVVTVSGDLGSSRFLWQGELIRLEAEIDERSRMVYGVSRLKMDYEADIPALPVGLFVHAEIEGERVENIVRLPRSSIRDDNQVLVVDGDSRLRFRQVSILRLEHDEVLIDAGLSGGELVCISPLQTVVDGMLVRAVRD